MTPRDVSIDLHPGYQDSYRLVAPNAPRMEPISRWHVIGLTPTQLRNSTESHSVAGFDREGEGRTLEMVAHLMHDSDLIVLQRQG